jgi:beta-lactam-binding protein with PASTA domain
MSWKRRFIMAAVVSALGITAVVLGLQLIGRDDQRSFVDDAVVIPIVLGKTEADATAMIEHVGLRPDIRYSRSRAKHPRMGQVVAQGPSRLASRGDSVVIVVAVAKPRPRQGGTDVGDGWTNYAPLSPS